MMKDLIDRLEAAPRNDPRRACEIGHLAFMEWLGGLPGHASYPMAAMAAYDLTREVAAHSVAAAVFRDLLVQSSQVPPRPLGLRLPLPARRGGTRSRRLPQ